MGFDLGDEGLSPRVRGNHFILHLKAAMPGSIPARAGEPNSSASKSTAVGVYPRACGGTMPNGSTSGLFQGLSPRVRGNQLSAQSPWTQIGSIPARAGEPYSAVSSIGKPRVYPRACGGTLNLCDQGRPRSGLSPRVRGNHIGWRSVIVGLGSIPARAGEPQPAPRPLHRHRVYPRACGGTKPGHAAMAHPRGLSPRVRGNPRGPRRTGAPAGSIPARAGEPHVTLRRRTHGRVYPRACGGT